MRTAPEIGDALARDLQIQLDFIAEYFTGDTPHWFDQHLTDLNDWWAARAKSTEPPGSVVDVP